MSWTDERINTLKKMWKEGKSAAEIAKTLGKGVTRNAVIGKAHRMGLSGRPSPIKKPAPPKKEAAKAAPKAAAAAPKAATAKKAAPAAAPKVQPPSREAEEIKKMEREAPQIGGGVALIDLSERMCKWPIGDPREPDFSFCGRGIRPGTPYCPEHAAMAYQTSSRRGAARAVKDEEVEEGDAEDEVVVEDEDADAEDVA
jgi:GcrA cell cycle regulator